MEKQTKKVTVRMPAAVFSTFEKKRKVANLSKEAFIRKLINDVRIKPRPSVVYTQLLNRVCELLNKVDDIYIAMYEKGILTKRELDTLSIGIEKLWQAVKDLE